jgi:hypothetical protein
MLFPIIRRCAGCVNAGFHVPCVFTAETRRWRRDAQRKTKTVLGKPKTEKTENAEKNNFGFGNYRKEEKGSLSLRISAVPKAHFLSWLCHLCGSAVRKESGKGRTYPRERVAALPSR